MVLYIFTERTRLAVPTSVLLIISEENVCINYTRIPFSEENENHKGFPGSLIGCRQRNRGLASGLASIRSTSKDTGLLYDGKIGFNISPNGLPPMLFATHYVQV